MCATQESVSRLLLDDEALKNPIIHVSHVGCVVVLPIFSVYLPGGHFVWAVQELVVVLLLDVEAAKNPFGHPSHAVTGPIMCVYFPGGHETLVVGVVVAASMA